MAVYLITPLAQNADKVRDCLKQNLDPSDVYELQSAAGWLVSYKGTSVELSNQIGITSPTGKPDNGPGSTMVTSIGSYYGMGSTAMWEGLKTRFENQA